jgi:hypothetical protein
MTNQAYKVQVQSDYLSKITRAQPVLALTELGHRKDSCENGQQGSFAICRKTCRRRFPAKIGLRQCFRTGIS